MNILLSLVAILVAGILAGVVGRLWGRSIRRGVGFASVMLGFGMVLDPPAHKGVEAADRERKRESGKDEDI
ncbi:hypothetical protein [Asticcacaulis sp. AC460]|uniref:hypothetical protein n=1 Tax=Asticcacaulis sp. AC460 TaxID=1282360 RepID=UPI0012DD2F24|nr:hypothetical protein [Asticcacaulis sp. AC460]